MFRDSCSIATASSCPRESFRGQLPEKTFSSHLSSNLLNETPKGQSSRLKVVEDLKLSFDSYRNLVFRLTWLPTISCVTVFCICSQSYRTEQKDYRFSKESCWRLWFDSYQNVLFRESCCGQLLEKTVSLLPPIFKISE